MTRNELFQFITENNLKEDVKKACGKPYNSVSTEELNKFVEAYKEQFEVEKTPKTNYSSLNRDECFSTIKAKHYEAEIKALYGKPYNSVSTDKLNEFIKNKQAENGIIKEEKKIETHINEASATKNDTNTNCGIDLGARKVLTALCTTLNMKELLKNLK